MYNIKVWKEGEIKAEEYLKKLGYKIIDKNCKIGGSEIDIIAVFPKKIQIDNLKREFKTKAKNKEFEDKKELRFYKNVLKNNIKSIEDIIVFVEVKARSSKKYGNPYEAVDEFKQHNIERGCVSYLKKNKKFNKSARIDVISVIDDDIEHIENAFELKIY